MCIVGAYLQSLSVNRKSEYSIYKKKKKNHLNENFRYFTQMLREMCEQRLISVRAYARMCVCVVYVDNINNYNNNINNKERKKKFDDPCFPCSHISSQHILCEICRSGHNINVKSVDFHGAAIFKIYSNKKIVKKKITTSNHKKKHLVLRTNYEVLFIWQCFVLLLFLFFNQINFRCCTVRTT